MSTLKFTVCSCLLLCDVEPSQGRGPTFRGMAVGAGRQCLGVWGSRALEALPFPIITPFCAQKAPSPCPIPGIRPKGFFLAPPTTDLYVPKFLPRCGVPRSVAHPNILNSSLPEDVPTQPCLRH